MSDEQFKKATCEQHGEYTAKNHRYGAPNLWPNIPNKPIWSKCPECAEIEHIESQRRAAEKELREKQERWERTQKEAAIPERFRDRTLDTFVADTEAKKRVHAFAVEYAEGFEGKSTGRCAIFGGTVGTGKTHLAIGIANHIMSTYQKDAVFVTVQRLIRHVRESWRKDSEYSEREAIRTFVYPDLLIIDEIGIQAGSENEKQLLFDILNDRYERRKSTLLLTNLTIEELKGFLGERVFDRLREDGGQFLPFTWDSYRGNVK